MKTIKDYIQFAIDNDYKGINFPQEINQISNDIIIDKLQNKYSIIKLITSKDYIEAITRGIFDNEDLLKSFSLYYYGNDNKVYYLDRTLDENLNNLSNDICKFQAIAIRDGEMEKFITNLLNND